MQNANIAQLNLYSAKSGNSTQNTNMKQLNNKFRWLLVHVEFVQFLMQ
jgi:hypothetical protein